MTLTKRQINALLDDHGLAPSRALGQNFVADPNTVRRIARLARVGRGDHVVEIGPGVGSLTLALVETGAQITAIELDRGLVDVLGTVLADTNVRLIAGDAMHIKWSDVLGDDAWVLVANLPYNIATPLICDLLDDEPAIARMVVMVQREVADRIVAQPGSRTYGIPSVKVAYWASARIVANVGPDVFVPRPRVDSAVVEITRHAQSELANRPNPQFLFHLVTTAFGQRRKMLRRSLADLISDEAYALAAIAPTARPEELALSEWITLTRCAQAASRE